MHTYKLQLSQEKEYFTEPILQKEEWLQLLPLVEKKHPQQYETLLMFLRQPEHKSTCIGLSKEYSVTNESINNYVWGLGKFVIKETGNKFRIERQDGINEAFWPVAMLGRDIKAGFEYKLRPELVGALQEYLLEKLVQCYEERVLEYGLTTAPNDELYKWKLITNCQGKSTEEILTMLCKTNIIDNRFDGAAVIKLLDSDKEETIRAFDNLRGEDWATSYADYKKAADELTAGKFNYKISDERMAADFAACCNPERHTFYKSDLYVAFCKYIGEEKKSAGEKYEHYLSLLPLIIRKENEHDALINKLHEETKGLLWSERLNAQDVLWQMQSYMQEKISKNWLQKLYDKAIASNNSTYAYWYPRYRAHVDRFLGLFEEGKTALDSDEETIASLVRAQNNAISSIKQGCYSKAEFSDIMKHWPEIFEILQRNVLQGRINPDDYNMLKNLLRTLTSRNKEAAFHRIWAGLFPCYVSTIVADSKFLNLYQKIREIDVTLPPYTNDWLKDNVTLMEYVKQKVVFREPEHASIFPWYLYEELNQQTTQQKMDKYINLLIENHNLILTGAPGTGKTYMAKQIAEAMGAEYEIVQFHPSYDYTDFVEGLRPREDMSGFERVNGVFKDFCARAISSVKTSDFDEAYGKLISDVMEMEKPLLLKTPQGKEFGISVNSQGNLKLHTGAELKANGCLTKDKINAQLGDDGASKYWQGYYKGVENLLREQYHLQLAEKKGDEKYVFIIDEINRGELSKIFGELFFAIDPGYRGLDDKGKPKGMVKTQYQNMVDVDDVFHEGFYVPENVYILGTMNDIDRGVETMDFAIRRRFGWYEVTAEERMSMLDDHEWTEQAKASISALNKAIESEEVGLSRAYHIGPAYYLKLDQYDGDFERLWEYHIKGLLFEYLRGDKDVERKIENILKPAFEKYKDVNQQ